MSFRCVVVTPEQQTLDETITQAVVPAHDGLIGILTDRAPLLVKLGVGPLRIDVAGGESRTYFIDGGIAQMKSNNLTILTNEATLPQEINVEAARAEYAEAEARKVTDPKSADQRNHLMARGRVKQEMAGKRS
ncbi:MAG TPA: ATP synthase F1 subunit epsilon [Tepidisphaeraceae bacterium]|jgi:F-type H+-transporting ATPase subunit epsilon|nr:ATP synthase F1 subunit epsilon [Tepidisphaeraceae bacterium]